MVGSVSRLSPIVADCCLHAAIPISAVSNNSTTASVTLWYYFKQLLLLFNSIHHLLPPPSCLFFCHLPSLSAARHPPTAFVAILSLAVFVTTRSRPIVRNLRLILPHRPPYPSGLVASSTASRPRDDIAAIIAAIPCRLLLIACSCHVVHTPPTVSPRPPPCSNRSCCAFRRPLSSCRPTASATTSTLPLSPLMSQCSRCKTLMSTLTTRG